MTVPIKIRLENKGIIDGLRKCDKECIKPRAGDAQLWIKKGKITQLVRKKYNGGSGARQGTPHEEGK